MILSKHKMKTDEINIRDINNYNVYSFYARNKLSKGGVIIFAKSALKIKEIVLSSTHTLPSDQILELCSFEICFGKLKILLCGVSRYPICGNFKLFLERINLICIILSHRYDKIVIQVCGDMNIDIISNNLSKMDLKKPFKQFGNPIHTDEK